MKKYFALAALIIAFSIPTSISSLAEGNSGSGNPANTWVNTTDGKWYYFNDDGNLQSGWITDSGKTYYLTPQGNRISGEAAIDGKAYTFGADGALICEGISRNGMDSDILSQALVLCYSNWNEMQEFTNKINNIRAEVGAAPLELDFQLSVIATYRSLHMSKYGYFNHYSNLYNSTKPAHMIDYGNYFGSSREYSYIGENINRIRYYDISQEKKPIDWIDYAFEGLKNSPSHYENMIDIGWKKVGVGFASNYDPSLQICYTTNIFEEP